MVDTSNAGTGSHCMGFEHNMYDSCSDKGTVGRLVMSAVQWVLFYHSFTICEDLSF